ncbi:type VII secretion protein EccCa [Micromonospora rosaria]|uniref:type VII secretion protein EccCa n=1 Tax=Micromonospora rosaria TaxID=47874 RepID=UPI001B802605|nr:type VII secretion protein EccCa [Micromonospora rosaria]
MESPPTLPDGKALPNVVMLVPAVGVAGSMSMMLFSRGSAFAVLGALVLVGALVAGGVLLLAQRGQASRTRREQRERYLDYLEELRGTLATEEKDARARARLLSPSPGALVDTVRDPARLWERRRRDADFLAVRAGLGTVPARPVELPDRGTALSPTDPFMLAEARAILRRFRTAPGMPLVVPLDRVGNVSVIGPRASVLRAVRALLVQTAAWHAPDDVALAVAHPPQREADWHWVKWLPHVLDRDVRDGAVPARRIAPDPAHLRALLHPELTRRAAYLGELRRGASAAGATALHRLLVVHDTYGSVASDLAMPDPSLPVADAGVTVLHLAADRLHEPDQVAVRLTVTGADITVEDLRTRTPTVYSGHLDPVDDGLAEGVARLLAPLRLSPDSTDDVSHGGAVDVTTLLGLDDPTALDVPRLWAARGERAFLRVLIGLDDVGKPLFLDLKESAQLGMGPHGLCVGATGSGKSELLRTLVLSLAVCHAPDLLAMVLIDYKGGATFAPLAALPQVAGVITNLEDDPGLIERAYASLDGEVKRRQQVLRSAGNVANVTDYAVLREKRSDLPPLPSLLVIVDEFGELLTARPDFIELFLTIGRIGRSIGVHLLLSSQRVDGSRLRGLENHLSYRLGLRTFSEAESRTVLDTPDAYHLPPLPGFGYLKVDTTVYERFKAAYVSGRHTRAAAAPASGDQPGPAYYRQYRSPPARDEEAAPMPERVVEDTLLDVVVRQLAGAATPVHQIWLPPLPAAVTLDQIAGPVTADADGLRLAASPGALRVPVGILDDPARQRQELCVVDLTEAGGHLAVIGGPQSGKTTLLRTLVMSLALTHTPKQVAVYGIDLAGSGLAALADFPHVGGVTGRGDRERIRRTVEEVRLMLEHRELLCRGRGIDSVERLRDAHASGAVPELPSADVILLVDGFGALRSEFDDLEPMIADLLQRGSGYGVHVIASMLRWNDVRIAHQAAFGIRIEARLGDPTDSVVGRRLAETIGADQPGRVLTTGGLVAQVALPRVDGLASRADLGDVTRQVAGTARAAWPGERVPAIRVLPEQVPVALLPGPAAMPEQVPIGVDELALAPVALDLFGADGHLVVLGDGASGKTNLIRVIAAGLRERYSADEVTFAVMDPRQRLRDLVPEPYLGGYAHHPRLCAALAVGMAKELAKRLSEDPTVRGFDGPRAVLLIDDYDMLTAAGQRPLEALLPYVPSARDIGLHVVLARRVAGAARGSYDPFLLAVRESGATGLVLAGDRGEGPLYPGVYAQQQPPGRGFWVCRGAPVRLVQTALGEEDG